MLTSCQEGPAAKASGPDSLPASGLGARPELEAEGEEAAWSHPDVASRSRAETLSLSVPWTAWASVRPSHPSQQNVRKCVRENVEGYKENQLYCNTVIKTLRNECVV